MLSRTSLRRRASRLQHLRHFIHPRLPAAFLFLAHLHAEGDVVAHRQMGEQGIVLEDHCEVALARRGGGDVLIMQPDLAFADRFQPGEQA